jgi:hypothetical protein
MDNFNFGHNFIFKRIWFEDYPKSSSKKQAYFFVPKKKNFILIKLGNFLMEIKKDLISAMSALIDMWGGGLLSE